MLKGSRNIVNSRQVSLDNVNIFMNTAKCTIGLPEYHKDSSRNTYPYTIFHGFCIISWCRIPEYCLQYPERLEIIL